MREVHVVVPDGIDDPARPSGGNAYDRHVCRGLASLGWSVHEHPVFGDWPRRAAASLAALADAVTKLPDGAVVLIDGLIASATPDVLVAQARRLRLVVLVHMPLGHRPADDVPETRKREGAVLLAATAVVTTSEWGRRRLLELYRLPTGRLHVAAPGVEIADLATGTDAGGRLLCVAAVTFDKGHDLLLDALETISELSWNCLCVGSLERDPLFVEGLRGRSARVDFAGPRTGPDLDRSYAAADLLVLPSRAETYGMVITEALARGLPVVAADVGGATEALGWGADGVRPGLLVPAEDPAALGAALRTWLLDAGLRTRSRTAARERRASLSPWSSTAAVVADVLASVSR